jgi:hypothetical protein
MTDNGRHLTPLDFDRLGLATVDPVVERQVEAHIASCPACAERRALHAALHAQFTSAVFPRTVAKVGRRQTPRWRWSLWLAVPALGAVALFGHRLVQDRRPDPIISVKGASLVEVFARRNAAGSVGGKPAVVRVAEGARLASGDALRFVLYPTGLSHVLIASVDGAGAVSIYFPFHGEASATIDGRTAMSVPGSIVLDQAPGPERLFIIYSAQPVSARAVREALAATAAAGPSAIRVTRTLPLPGTTQATVMFEKEGSQ